MKCIFSEPFKTKEEDINRPKRGSCLRSAVFLLPFLLDCSTNVANESIASKTIPRRKNIVLRGTIGSGWEEGS